MISTKKVSLTSIITQTEGNVVSDMDGEKVMLSIESGNYYNLGELGGEIWDLIKSPMEINHLVNTLLLKYQVEKEECEQHVLSYIEQLEKERLIQIINLGE
ncbi:lasso peptide biosynthesis PqqD family chaperone [Neobacillus soli]|uniref:lasso peptide biosynthesis PqqD family chaperone n=1 Tax=Neobacillus soli TaxID=220688 RepID=UPI000824BFBF|nr:lasso peptide biosynthesis PqqD family chaperone [Neobacillus soli]